MPTTNDTNVNPAHPIPPGAVRCAFCGGIVSREAAKCPSCGYEQAAWDPVAPPSQSKPGYRKELLVLIIVLLLTVGYVIFTNVVSSTGR